MADTRPFVPFACADKTTCNFREREPQIDTGLQAIEVRCPGCGLWHTLVGTEWRPRPTAPSEAA